MYGVHKKKCSDKGKIEFSFGDSSHILSKFGDAFFKLLTKMILFEFG